MDPNGLLAQLQVLDPKIALESDVSPAYIAAIALKFLRLVSLDDISNLHEELRESRLLPDVVFEEDKCSVPSFWFKLLLIKDGLDRHKFATLSRFMTSLTALPHSTAAVEHVFSQVNCTTTSRSNRMTTESVKCKMLA